MRYTIIIRDTATGEEKDTAKVKAKGDAINICNCLNMINKGKGNNLKYLIK